jgi:hypothetical protein
LNTSSPVPPNAALPRLLLEPYAQLLLLRKTAPLKSNGVKVIVVLLQVALLLHRVIHMSLISRSPHWQTRVNCHRRRRRQAAVARGALRSHHGPAQAHQSPEVVFRASPSAASAAAPRLRCCGMLFVWASAPHALQCGVRVPPTGHCACRHAHDDGALGWVDNGACDAGSREESAGAAAAARVLCCALRLSCQCLRATACVPVLVCAVCLTRAAGNGGWFSGPLLRIAAAASSAPWRSFLCAGCCCRPRCRQTRHYELGSRRRRRFGALPCDC